MELTATITQILPLVTGQGKNGEWQKQEFIVETKSGEYTKKLCLSLWGDKIVPMSVGQQVKIQFDVESREYNSRWYTECKAWKIEVVGQQQPATQQPAAFAPPAASQPEQGGGDQLRF